MLLAPARLAWLDALRGPAALAVTMHHAGWTFVPEVWAEVDRRIDAGTWGVFVFFLVSGYIIPASLERRGDLRAFWTGRAFRLLPLLLAAFCLALLLASAGLFPLAPGLAERPLPVVALGNVTMLQELLNLPSVISVTWTLSYELAFYLMCVALFTARQAHRSAGIAVALAVGAVGAGLLIPRTVIGGRADLVAAVLALAVVAAIAVSALGRGRARTVAAVAGGLLGLALVVLGSRGGTWQGVIILATMFAGTAIHRAEQGTISWRAAGLAVAAVLGCGIFAKDDPAWAPALVLAFGAFGLAFALRRRRFPAWLPWLGVISFSLYLLHPLLLYVTPDLPLFLLALVPLSFLTYHLIEAPAQRLGKRLATGSDLSRPPGTGR
ncbi:Peptidoglycan/LPS O-acetylase OafA/YrhL, contains acyltransferase and SGNH-hydrolase domains [Nonomuraea solani]|uniref:Peptidoglycan/LPS O-acetylase OafA/YrhL, contains acyltransferase and SGNH-hydrolase domains n=1 Tax=Nonomuraea solani TaxID=1144553 RepID=A0A1H5VS99_9ACTN|nr:acyltransferase family protein [Nonomuraea solani]SEF90104.1 Peptidoglycan/LPS O-acetylase OafA/YrhL, contains acyltransferase and SGNH-hydrolase domains [Nonomuraea solani]